jgi:flagellar basal-body rod protein FlgF
MKEVYQILSGAMGLEKRLDQISNNMANVNTPGFKRDGAAFVDFFRVAMKDQAAADPKSVNYNPENPSSLVWPTMTETYADQSRGLFQPTDHVLDVAIQSDGFFKVEVEGKAEPAYTRAGNFRVNDEEYLVTIDGRRVLDDGGKPIEMKLNGKRPQITIEGKIMAGEEEVATLGVARFSDPDRLIRHGQSLFFAPADMKAEDVEEPNLRQGFLESSNVNPIEEMIDMIRVQRAYGVEQKVIQTIDELTSRRIEAAQG